MNIFDSDNSQLILIFEDWISTQLNKFSVFVNESLLVTSLVIQELDHPQLKIFQHLFTFMSFQDFTFSVERKRFYFIQWKSMAYHVVLDPIYFHCIDKSYSLKSFLCFTEESLTGLEWLDSLTFLFIQVNFFLSFWLCIEVLVDFLYMVGLPNDAPYGDICQLLLCFFVVLNNIMMSVHRITNWISKLRKLDFDRVCGWRRETEILLSSCKWRNSKCHLTMWKESQNEEMEGWSEKVKCLCVRVSPYGWLEGVHCSRDNDRIIYQTGGHHAPQS